MNRTRQQTLSLCLAFILLFSVCGGVTRAAGRNVTDLISPSLALTVRQEGNIVAAGGTLSPEQAKPVSATVTFSVPVLGDIGIAPQDAVLQNDTASFLLADGFSLPATTQYELSQNGTKVGTLTIVDSNGALAANILFDGAAAVFSPTGGYNHVVCTLTVALHYDGVPTADEPLEETVTILGESFTMRIPETPTTFAASKTGAKNAANGQYIDWDVTVTPTKGTAGRGKLGGCVFTDTLTDVGAYVPGSFKVTNSDGAVVTTADPAVTAPALTYTFPAGCEGVHHVEFQTETPDAKFFSQKEETVENIATITSDGKTSSSPKAVVEYDIEWIKKSQAVTDYTTDPTKVYMTWTITANTARATLPNAVIRDILGKRLTFVSATLDTMPANTWVRDAGFAVPAAPVSTASSGDKNWDFELGSISVPVQLTIKAYFPVETGADSSGNIEHRVHRIPNQANIRWDTYAGNVGTGVVNTDIGFNPIKKE